MGKQYLELTPQHIDFIQQQKIFFVATAAETGSVNLSPKGGDSLRVIDHKTIVWQNLRAVVTSPRLIRLKTHA